jgi:flagellar protein FlgJ
MIAQAGHESGWGRHEIRHADGTPTHNLFGIKAGAQWKGPVAEVTTTEYVDGQPKRLVQRFRAYASHAGAFADYAALMKSRPRYQAVRAAGGDARAFAEGLQRAGYATDPRYADKLSGAIATIQRLRASAA